MHKRLVFNIVSRIVLIVSFLMLVPLAWAVADNPRSQEVDAFLLTITLGLAMSFVSRFFFRFKPEDFEKVNAKDGLAVVGLAWLFLSFFGALPLYLTHSVPTYIDGFFEITSGFTTTGATVMTNIESLPRGILFWRSLTHWLGGMGIIVLYLALLPMLGQNAFQLYKAEAPGLTVERIQPRIKQTAFMLWTVYFVLSLAETILLMFGGMPLFDALCHTFGTMATGGFSTKSASIGHYSPYIQWVVIVFMFLAGTNFILHYLAMKGKLRAYWKSEEFRSYALLIAILIPAFALILSCCSSLESPLRAAAFQVVSIMTTTGYVTENFELWPEVLRFGLIILMFIGGCGGSTGGGLKVIRILLAGKTAVRSIVRAVFPNLVHPIKFNGVPLNPKVVSSVMSYFVLFIVLFFAGTLLLTITERCDLITAFSASIASLSNIGPGLGRVGAVQNYAWVSLPGKLVLIFLMLAGRLELYSILVLLVPSTWKK